MSSEIHYAKAFIRVQDKFIPMVCHGSNNSWDISPRGREIPDKNWNVLNYPFRGRLLFSNDEIRQIAAQYKQICAESGGGIWKSRNNVFLPDEFERWILAGMKSARTIDEYLRYGNCLYLSDYDTNLRLPIRSEQELLKALEEYEGRPALQLHFFSRDIYLPKRPREQTDYSKLACYYVLKMNIGYLAKLSSNRIWYVPNIEDARKFKTEKQANRYLEKNQEKLKRYACRVQCIEKRDEN